MKQLSLFGAAILVVAAVGLWMNGCALSVAPTSSEDRVLTLELAAFPEELPERDSAATAEIWATLRRGTDPVRDSTLVFFAVSAGTITPSSYTKDGLAIAHLIGPPAREGRDAVLIAAQALTVRTSLDVPYKY